jgi:hypothetical protein
MLGQKVDIFIMAGKRKQLSNEWIAKHFHVIHFVHVFTHTFVCM